MPLESSTLHVRNRSALPALGLLALCAALGTGFVGATWRGEVGPRTLERLSVPAAGLASCVCPDPARQAEGRP
jgi:hypothetical protein